MHEGQKDVALIQGGKQKFKYNFTKSVWLFWSECSDRMANSVEPDQTAPVGAV